MVWCKRKWTYVDGKTCVFNFPFRWHNNSNRPLRRRKTRVFLWKCSNFSEKKFQTLFFSNSFISHCVCVAYLHWKWHYCWIVNRNRFAGSTLFSFLFPSPVSLLSLSFDACFVCTRILAVQWRHFIRIGGTLSRLHLYQFGRHTTKRGRSKIIKKKEKKEKRRRRWLRFIRLPQQFAFSFPLCVHNTNWSAGAAHHMCRTSFPIRYE